MRCIIHLRSWMHTELKLTGDLLCAFAIIYDALRFHQNLYISFRQTIDNMSVWFDSDRKRTLELLEELERLNLLLIERVQVDGETYAKITIYEPNETTKNEEVEV